MLRLFTIVVNIRKVKNGYLAIDLFLFTWSIWSGKKRSMKSLFWEEINLRPVIHLHVKEPQNSFLSSLPFLSIAFYSHLLPLSFSLCFHQDFPNYSCGRLCQIYKAEKRPTYGCCCPRGYSVFVNNSNKRAGPTGWVKYGKGGWVWRAGRDCALPEVREGHTGEAAGETERKAWTCERLWGQSPQDRSVLII